MLLLALVLLPLACGGEAGTERDVPEDAPLEVSPSTTVVEPRVIQVAPQEQRVTPLQSAAVRPQEAAQPVAQPDAASSSRSLVQPAVLLALAGVLVVFAVTLVLLGRRKQTR